MTIETFQAQLQRLISTYGEKPYPQERAKLILNAVKNLPEEWMVDTVTWFIGYNRSAPILPDFLKKIDEYADRQSSSRMYQGFEKFGIGGVIRDAKNKNRVADKDFVKACTKLLNDKLTGKITHKQFLEGCDLLDEAAKHFGGT